MSILYFFRFVCVDFFINVTSILSCHFLCLFSKFYFSLYIIIHVTRYIYQFKYNKNCYIYITIWSEMFHTNWIGPTLENWNAYLTFISTIGSDVIHLMGHNQTSLWVGDFVVFNYKSGAISWKIIFCWYDFKIRNLNGNDLYCWLFKINIQCI